MEHLFNYTKALASNIISLVEDIAVLQRILKEKKNSPLTEEKIQNRAKEVNKLTYNLRILEHVSYLEEYQNDIRRAVSSIDSFLEVKTYSNAEVRKITSHLSTICQEYDASIEKSGAAAEASILCKTTQKLEGTMKVIEEVLLSYYGLASPVDNLEEKLIKSVETLFTVKIENLEMEEKLLLEEFFTLLQKGFETKSLEAWEEVYIGCNNIMNKLKVKAGMEPNTSLTIDVESYELDDEDKPEEEGE